MSTYQLRFYLCCCRSFLKSSSTHDGEDDYYQALGIERDASVADIKKAFKQKSRQLHPDKIQQAGRGITEEDTASFNRVRDAYEVLSDPTRKDTYDMVGEKGLKWIEEPFSINPVEAMENFASSSAFDRSKIFIIFVFIFGLIFLMPILVCMKVDGDFDDATWVQVFIPIWIKDTLLLIHHINMLRMGPIPKPEEADDDWEDPFPMSKRLVNALSFGILLWFEIMLALKLDHETGLSWGVVFIPIWLNEISTFLEVFPVATMKIMTTEEFADYMGKSPSEITEADKEDALKKRIHVVRTMHSPESAILAHRKEEAQHHLYWVFFKDLFILFLVLQLEEYIDWDWWAVFFPIWIFSLLLCLVNCKDMSEVAKKAEAVLNDGEQVNYGSVEDDSPELSDGEKETIQAELEAARSKFSGICCNQCFFLLMVFLLVGKANGADYSSFWIISPLLIMCGFILCCLGCAFYCIQGEPNDRSEDVENTYTPPTFSTKEAETTDGDEKSPSEVVDLLPGADIEGLD